MTCFHVRRFLFTLISIFTICEYVSSQVNTDTVQLTQELIIELGVKRTTSWFKPNKMGQYAKFLLCVDVYQKKLGFRLMNDHYLAEDGTTTLPAFETDTLKIIATNINHSQLQFKEVMHCPLHEIQFLALDYSTGEDFYISDCSTKFCVFVFTKITSEQQPILEVKAKVCDILIHVRHDRLTLDEEVASELMQSGINRMKWSQLEGLDNDISFMICLDIYEKKNRVQLYSQFYNTPNNKDALPSFDIVHRRLSLINDTGEYIIEDFELLYCPLDYIWYPKEQIVLTPFYLAKSYQDDCVYYMRPIDNQYMQLATIFSIQKEICGIFGYINTDADYLERDLVARLNISQELSFNFFDWTDLPYISHTARFLMCINAMKKIHMEYFYVDESNLTSKSRHPVLDRYYKLYLNQIGILNQSLSIFKCVMNRYIKHPLAVKPFFLALSPKIDCVYKLIIPVSGSETILKIDSLVCGIYPSRYSLLLT